MPNPKPERVSQIGDFWLSHDKKSPEIWCITWFDQESRQTRRRSTGLRDIASAEVALAKWVIQHSELREEQPEDVALEVVLDRYYEKHASKKTSKNSALSGIRYWKKFWGPKTRISDLSVARQNDFEDWLRKQTYTRGKSPAQNHLSDGSVARYWNVGPTALEWARNAQEIKYYPPVRFLVGGEPRKRVLTIEESAALFNAVEAEHEWRWLILSFGTAARPNAPLDIRPGPPMLDLTHQRIDLLPPGKKQDPRKRRPILPIAGALLPWLRLWTQPDQLVYQPRRKGSFEITRLITWRGKPIKQIGQTFERLKARANITDPRVIPYAIRHTIITWFMHRRVDEYEREVWPGHRAPGSTTTAGYVHLDPEYLRGAADAVDAYFRLLAPLVRRPLILDSSYAPPTQE